MQKLLTIVVPVYKVEQYINKCLDSCIIYKADGSLNEEKMNQLEVIIVNDGTPDNSAELSRVYTKRYPKTFRQIDKENGGHGSAWNVGLKEATGKYLRFLDSDDWLTNLDKLMEKLQDCDADLVMTHRQLHYENDGHDIVNALSGLEFNVALPIPELIKSSGAGPCVAFWYCTYKSSILKPLYPLFKEKSCYDDSVLYMASFIHAKTFMVLNFVVYNYLLGRVGQSSDLAIFEKRSSQHISAFFYMIDKWKLNASNSLENTKVAYKEADNYASWLIGTFASLKIKNMYELQKLKPYAIERNLNGSKLLRRFLNWPFFIFCGYEKLRQLKNNKNVLSVE